MILSERSPLRDQMAPRSLSASQWAKRTFSPKKCRVQSTATKQKNRSQEPFFNSLLPIGTAHSTPTPMEVCTAQESQKRTTCAADSDLRLPFTDLSSQESSRPSIDDLVRTPPPWKSPYIIDSTSPKAALRVLVPDAVGCTSPELQLPLSVCESEYNCGSPTKTPGRVARVFGQLHPITPRKKSEKNFIRRGVHAMCRMGTVIGIKAPPRQFKSLADLRRLLLQRHRSLHKAFREMENHLQEFKQQEGTAWKKSKAISGNHSMDLLEFSRAIAFCGIDHYEAQHFFKLMDTNEDGFITIEEFKTSLVTMPRDVLLQDFRSDSSPSTQQLLRPSNNFPRPQGIVIKVSKGTSANLSLGKCLRFVCCGLAWMRRNLHYYSTSLTLMLRVPFPFGSYVRH